MRKGYLRYAGAIARHTPLGTAAWLAFGSTNLDFVAYFESRGAW
jgi:hypothetical protein